MTGVLAGILAYVAGQLAIGFWASRRIHSEDDYLLAGRNVGLALGLFTVFATWFGAETCIGAAGSIYEEGLGGGTADPFGYGVCLLLMGAVFAVPLWRLKLTTLGDLFRRRYSPTVERLVVLLIVPTSVMWAAAQIRAFGQVLAASSNLDVFAAITIAAAAVLAYTVAGGLMADVVTDFVQGLALLAGLVVLFAVLAVHGDGLSAAYAAVPPERWALFGGPDTPWYLTVEAWAIPICGSVLAQELVARVIAIRSPSLARSAALGAGALYLLVGMIPVTVGLIGPQLLPDLEHGEQVLPLLAKTLLPTWMYVLFAGALVSAILSTVDSALLVAGSLLSHNVILRLNGRDNASETTKVRWARLCVIGFGVIAYGLALAADGVYELVAEASALGSAGVFVSAVAALFLKRGGPRAALAALTSGLVVYVLCAYVLVLDTPYLISLAAAVAAYVLGARGEPRFAGWAAEQASNP